MALSKIDVANMVENQMPQANVADNVKFRNIIINGDMSIAQRGTSFSGLTASQYTIDRHRFGITTAGTWTISQSTDVPSGQGFAKSMKWDCTTADASLAASDNLLYQTRLEGQNLQYLKKGTSSAESTTLSFWVKSNKTGTYTAEIYDQDNTRQISKTYTISSADTWEKKTITFAGDTTGTLDNDNARSLDLLLWLGAGSNFTSGTLNTSWNSVTTANRVSSSQVNLADSTSNEWYITGIQLEAGTTASDFEFLPTDVNRERCLRYFIDLLYIGASGYATGANQTARARTTIVYPVHMRASPTRNVTNNSGSNVHSDSAFASSANEMGGLYTRKSAASGGLYWSADLELDAEL